MLLKRVVLTSETLKEKVVSHNFKVSLKIITVSSLNRSKRFVTPAHYYEVMTVTTESSQQAIIITLSNQVPLKVHVELFGMKSQSTSKVKYILLSCLEDISVLLISCETCYYWVV